MRDIKIQRFCFFFLAPEVLHRCRTWAPRVFSDIWKRGFISNKGEIRSIRLVVPYRKASMGLTTELSKVLAKWSDVLRLAGLQIDVGAFFKRAGAPISLMLRRSNNGRYVGEGRRFFVFVFVHTMWT